MVDIALKSSESTSKVNKTKLSVLKPVKIITTTICNRQTGREISEKISKIAHYISLELDLVQRKYSGTDITNTTE